LKRLRETGIFLIGSFNIALVACLLPLHASAREMRQPGVLHHILVTGQSLAIGINGMPPLTTNRPYGNLMLTQSYQDGTNLVPLIEGVWPVETMNSALANTLTSLS
jgi:hypothetical protein